MNGPGGERLSIDIIGGVARTSGKPGPETDERLNEVKRIFGDGTGRGEGQAARSETGRGETNGAKYTELMERAAGATRSVVAARHRYDEVSRKARWSAAKLGLIKPVLIGLRRRIRDPLRSSA